MWVVREISGAVAGTRGKILSALEAALWPLSPKEIAEAAGLAGDTVRQTVIRMTKDGQLRALEGGKYMAAETSEDDT
jgi:DNA-binding transcriptional ArsR family regulator